MTDKATERVRGLVSNGAKPLGWGALGFVAAIIFAWWQFEAHIDRRILAQASPIKEEIAEVKADVKDVKKKVNKVAEQQAQQKGQLDTIESLLRQHVVRDNP